MPAPSELWIRHARQPGGRTHRVVARSASTPRVYLLACGEPRRADRYAPVAPTPATVCPWCAAATGRHPGYDRTPARNGWEYLP